MDKTYISGGTLRTCPYTDDPEVITFNDYGEHFDRTQCPHHAECTDDSCPLCNHLKY